MTLIPVIWSPDTCPCIFNITWDDVNLSHGLVSVTRICQFHSGLTDLILFNTVWNDNVIKNNSRQAGINALPSVLSTTGFSGGNLIPGITYHYGWTNFQSGRTLFIQYQGSGVAPNAIQQITIQSGVTAVASGRAFVTANISGISGITIVD